MTSLQQLQHLTQRSISVLLLIAVANLVIPDTAIADSGARKAYIIELQNQTPETLIPAIEPLLDTNDGISGFNNELIITTDAQRIENIRQIISKLDKPLQNLLIVVKNNNDGSTTNNNSGFSGSIRQENIRIDTGQAVQAQDGITVASDGLAYSMNSRKQTFSKHTEQQVRAVEGSPAFIYTGQSINLPSHDSYGNVYNTEVDANRGFYVTARINGDHVQLDISVSNDSFDQATGSGHRPIRNSQHLSTSISGQVGEWIALGGITLGESSQGNSLVKKTTTNSGSLGDISVKISPLD